MIEFFEAMQFWHWILLAIVLIAGEALGAAGFLLGAVMAALELALISYIWPDLTWQQQLSLFAVLALLCSVWFWYRFKNFNQTSAQPQLNARAAQLVGREFALTQTMKGGQGKIQVGDTLWRVEATTNLPVGTQIKVTGHRDMVLLIVKAGD
jgi:membrane protein implicated in regulation of membrane protease activity|tara:strand:- start:3174 stop:3629 length:456 start_codon:yes stop_codon:yes gene_type:complete